MFSNRVLSLLLLASTTVSATVVHQAAPPMQMSPQIDRAVVTKVFSYLKDFENETSAEAEVHATRIESIVNIVSSTDPETFDSDAAIRKSVTNLSPDEKLELVHHLSEACGTKENTIKNSEDEIVRLTLLLIHKTLDTPASFDHILVSKDVLQNKVQQIQELSKQQNYKALLNVTTSNNNNHRRLALGAHLSKLWPILKNAGSTAGHVARGAGKVALSQGRAIWTSTVAVGGVTLLIFCTIFDLVWNRVINDQWRVGKLTAAAVSSMFFIFLTGKVGQGAKGLWGKVWRGGSVALPATAPLTDDIAKLVATHGDNADPAVKALVAQLRQIS